LGKLFGLCQKKKSYKFNFKTGLGNELG